MKTIDNSARLSSLESTVSTWEKDGRQGIDWRAASTAIDKILLGLEEQSLTDELAVRVRKLGFVVEPGLIKAA